MGKGIMKSKRNRIMKATRRDCQRRHSTFTTARRGRPAGAKPEPAVRLPAPARPAVSVSPVEHQSYTGDSAFHLYVREIGQTKLLTPQEEIQLARRIQKGDARAREH